MFTMSWLFRARASRGAFFACRAIAAAGLVGGSLSACAPGSNLPTLPGTDPSAYRLGVNEEVNVVTYGQGQLSGVFHINSRGDIDLPLLGEIPAAGETTTGLEHQIEAQLKQKALLTDPNVTVAITKYRPIFILGEVKTPGEYPYQPGMTVLTAVAIAGGFTYRAVTTYASIQREVDDHLVEGRVSRNRAVEPGDVINIFERHF
jgi:polysaccharide biosynthesis/export protein